MSVSIKYKGSEILNIPSGGDYKLNTSGKYLEDDIRITDELPRHTATITGSGNQYDCYVQLNSTKYYSAGTFTYSAGDSLSIHVTGRMSGGTIIIDGETVESGGTVNHTMTLPTGDIEIELTYGTSGKIEITTSGGGGGSAISVVDTLDSHGGTIRTITAVDISDTTAVAGDVAQGKYFYTADGTKTEGTATSGGGSVDCPTFTVTFNSNYEVQSVTCDKTFAECIDCIDDGIEFAFVNMVIPNDGTYQYSFSLYRVSAAECSYLGLPTASYSDEIRFLSNGTISYASPSSLVTTLNVTQNGTYTDSQDRLYGSVTVNVSSATQHVIHLEFSDSTDTDIDVFYDDSSVGSMITASKPTTYGGKTVTLAQLDGVTWYEPANIPIGVELIDYTKCISGYYVDDDGNLYENQWSWASDYTAVDPDMTFSYTNYYWFHVGVYDENKNFLRTVYVMNDGTPDPNDSNTGHGTLSGNKLIGASYVRLCGTSNNSSYMSLIRTA